jgi:type I restriction enzyme, S subunit
MNWPTVKLGDVMTVGRGSSPRPIKDERFFTGGTIPWVKIADATASGKFIYQTNQHVNEYGASFSRRLKPGALIFPASGTLGIPRFLGVEACIHDGWLYFSDYQGIDPDWLYYRIILLKDYYEGIAYGAAIQNINTDIVRSTEIQLPDLATQRAMTAVLGAYDDLIATNQRRIALLEDAARRLYRQWFVYLRFPGHESMVVKDGVPEGWRKQTLASVADVNARSIGARDRPDSVLYIDISTVSTGLIGEVTPYAFADAPGRARRRVVHGDVIWSCVRPNRRSYALIWEPDERLVASTGFAVLSATGVPFSYLYFTTTTDAFVGHLEQNATGAAYPAVTAKTFEDAEILVPDGDTLAAFDHSVLPQLEQTEFLKQQNRALAQARDLLLPKLMSGQLDVSGIRLPEEATA